MCSSIQDGMAAIVRTAKHTCKLCGAEIANYRDRRFLHSDANKHVLLVMVELLAQLRGLDQQRSHDLLKPTAGSTAWICRYPCFQNLQCYTKLTQEVQSLGRAIQDKLNSTHELELPSVCPHYNAAPSPKRPCLTERRRLEFGPTGDLSPAVSVGIITL